MSIHFKTGEEWATASRVYVKVGGVWRESGDVYRKSGGSWNNIHHYDETPPSSPLLSLQVVDTEYREDGNTKNGRYLRVGVRLPQIGHVDDLKRIRVLSTYNDKAPTTQYGGTYTSGADDRYPNEPWSEFRYNGFGNHKDSSEYLYKSWPRTANNSTNLAPGKYFFAAWAEDLDGNWSQGVFAQIELPKRGEESANTFSREARFSANSSGTYRTNSGSFSEGSLKQSSNPNTQGMWFYGQQLKDNIGKNGKFTIRKAQIRVERTNDSGRPSANIYLFWTTEGSAQTIGASLDRKQVTHLGKVAKGETKWFDIPEVMYDNLDQVRSFGLFHKDPQKAAPSETDFSVLSSVTESARSGELNVVWTEKP